MHNIAEWILAQITSRERAASMVGDLLERAQVRGAVWFWSAVLRAAASLLWRDVAEKPVQILGLAFLGLAIYIGIEVIHAGLSGLLFFWTATASGFPLHLDSMEWKVWFALPVPVSSLWIGSLLARRAPGRELAACLVFAVLVSIYDLAPMLDNNSGPSALVSILIVLAAAAWGRRSRQLAGQPEPL